MKKMRQALALLLSVIMIASLAACGSNDGGNADGGESDNQGGAAHDTLIIGTQAMNGVWSPFFYTSAYDAQVQDLIFTSVCRLDADGELMDWAGHVEVEETADGKYVYTVTVQEGMTFSDGEPVTIDDVIFYYYVCADPAYDGMSTFGTLDIDGLAEYKNSAKHLYQLIAEAGQDNTDFTYFTQEQQDAFWQEVPAAGEQFAQTIVDYVIANGYAPEGASVAEAAAGWNYGDLAAEATLADFFNAIVANYDNLYTAVTTEAAETSFFSLMDEKWAEMVEVADVETIRGINRVDDYTVEVTFNSPNISAAQQVSWIPILPEHYYGADWSKGDLSSIKALNGAPVGSGPYVFESYESNVVTLNANPDYFKGEPKIPTVKVQAVNEEDKVDLVLNGEIDITDPSSSKEIIAQLDASTDKASYNLVDNPGYGYIGINAERVPDLNVRKGLMHLMNRAPAVASYYGDLGEVIERPMTPTLAEYPDDAEEFYGYDTAKALEYFQAAGYEQVDGKLVKDGEQLSITVGVGDLTTHPAAPILSQMEQDMAEMGAQLVVQDMEFTNLSNSVSGGQLDMWVMAWGNATDCDQTQMFGSEGGSNYQHYYSDELDAILEEIRTTIDFDARKELVAQSLDMIMDAAIYMPVYQRKNMEVYNATTLNLDTLPETTTYWNYVAVIETLEMQ